MSTREFIKMQRINFCYMSFMLQATNQKTVYMNGTYIQDVMMDEDENILAVMQDGEVIPAFGMTLTNLPMTFRYGLTRIRPFMKGC